MGTNGAWSSQLEIANAVVVFGPSGSPVGVFVYAAGSTPGPGNPPIAWMTNQAEDPYGNGVIPDVGASNGTATVSMSAGQINYNHGSFISESASGILTLGGTGGINAVQSLLPFVPPLTAVKPGTTATAETWHPISLTGTGFSTVAGSPVPSYQLLPDGNVQIVGAASHASFAATIPLSNTPLPAGYRPATLQSIAPFGSGSAGLQIDTGGNLTAVTGAAVGLCVFNGSYPVNL